jgi:hypothetical protein
MAIDAGGDVTDDSTDAESLDQARATRKEAGTLWGENWAAPIPALLAAIGALHHAPGTAAPDHAPIADPLGTLRTLAALYPSITALQGLVQIAEQRAEAN